MNAADGSVTTIASDGLVMPGGIAIGPDGNPTWGDSSRALMLVGIVVGFLGWLLGVAVAVWNRVLRMGRTGQSIGKSRMGLWLVDVHTGQPIGPGRCLARELVAAAANQAFYLSSLWMLWDEDRQTLADKVVGSTVVKPRLR